MNQINLNTISLNGDITRGELFDSNGKIKSSLISFTPQHHKCTSAEDTPLGIKWTPTGGSEITGTLAASESTINIEYYVQNGNVYSTYITFKKETAGVVSYEWGCVSSGTMDPTTLGFRYTTNMAVVPEVSFYPESGSTVEVTVTMNLNPLAEDSSLMYDSPEYSHQITPPYNISQTTTFYGRCWKGTTHVDDKITAFFVNKIYFGFGTSPEAAKSHELYYNTPVQSSVGITFTDQCGSTSEKFYVLVPGDVNQPNGFKMNDVVCNMTYEQKQIDGIIYNIYNTTDIASNKYIKITTF